VKLISKEEMEAIRKVSNQSQPVIGRKLSANDDDDKEDTNQISKSQADKGKILKIYFY
jgi:hypothetical protein